MVSLVIVSKLIVYALLACLLCLPACGSPIPECVVYPDLDPWSYTDSENRSLSSLIINDQ